MHRDVTEQQLPVDQVQKLLLQQQQQQQQGTEAGGVVKGQQPSGSVGVTAVAQ
jgi:hypothetical protein